MQHSQIGNMVMIDQGKIADYINHPQNLNEDTLNDIKMMLDEHPYIASLHMLYLRNLKNLGLEEQLANQLKISSIYIPDRTKLFYLLQKNISVASKEEVIEPEIVEEKAEQDIELTISEEYKNVKEILFFEGTSTSNTDEEISQDSLPSFDIDDYFEWEEPTDDLLEVEENTEVKEENILQEDRKEELAIEEEHLPEIAEEELKQREESGLVLDASDVYQLKEPEEIKNLSTKDIIYSFIEKNPRIVPKDMKADEKIEDISEKSTEENYDNITETLAQIYRKQGLFTKAIFAYEKLSLKYPEKSTFFASQIEEIKKLTNK